VIGAPLGVAEDDMAAAEIGQHGRADIAGVGALLGAMAVLGAQKDRTAGDFFRYGHQKMERRADQKFTGRRLVPQLGGEIARKAATRSQQAVHLPIARDQLPPHRALAFRCRPLLAIVKRP